VPADGAASDGQAANGGGAGQAANGSGATLRLRGGTGSDSGDGHDGEHGGGREGERGEGGSSSKQRSKRETHRLRIVAMNVGTLAMSSREEGAAADARSGTFSAAGSGGGSLNKLLSKWMREEGSHGRKRNSLFVLSSTQLPPKQIATVKRDFKGEGYECLDTHGVPGALRRIEVAGVMVCIDTNQLRFLPVGRHRKGSTMEPSYRRSVVKGRVMHVQIGILGGGAKHEFDLLAAYMPTRGSNRRGHGDAALDDYVATCWRRLEATVMQLARGGNMLLAGDLNAEELAMLRARRGTPGRSIVTPSDTALQHLVELAPISRLHTRPSDDGEQGRASATARSSYYAVRRHSTRRSTTCMATAACERCCRSSRW
jgi:hypothetical protein